MSIRSIFTDPSVDGPAFQFGLGIAGVASYYSTLPNVPGSPSSWHLAEWNTTQTLDPAAMTVNDSSEWDGILGLPSYSWTLPSAGLGFSAYGAPGNFAYRLSDYNGSLTNGGKNLFLETTTPQFLATLDHPVTFQADEALRNTWAGGTAQEVLNAFTLVFNLPGGATYTPWLPTYSAFLQVELSDSRGAPASYFGVNGHSILANVVGGDYLPFKSSDGLFHVSIDLNASLQQVVQTGLSRFGNTLPSQVADLSRWTVTSSYVGLETSDGGGTALDVSHLSVTTDDSQTYTAQGNKPVSITGAGAQAERDTSQPAGGAATTPLLYRNADTGASVAWDLSAGGAVTGSRAVGGTLDWSVVGSTGAGPAGGGQPVLWRQGSTGAVVMRPDLSAMSGMVVGGNGEWSVAGTGDFDGDGKADIVWHNAVNGATFLNFMGDAGVRSSALLTVDQDWSVAATGDFDGDGHTDLIWQSAASGDYAVWLMNGATVKQAAALDVGGGWKVIGTGDITGDGKDDIVVQNQGSGAVVQDTMNGASVSISTPLGGSRDWTVASVRDYNGDGRADLVWHGTGGSTVLWLTGAQSHTAVALSSDPSWTPVGV